MQGQESFEFHSHSVVTVVTLSCSRSRICVGFQNFFFISVGQLGYTSSSEADDIICMFAACISVDLLNGMPVMVEFLLSSFMKLSHLLWINAVPLLNCSYH